MHNKFLGTGEKGYHPLRKIGVCCPDCATRCATISASPTKLVLSLLVLGAGSGSASRLDFLMITAATAMVLVAELFSSAIEALCDFIETAENEKIKVIKDIAAAAAGISILLWAVVLVVELSRLYRTWLGQKPRPRLRLYQIFTTPFPSPP